MNNWKDLTRTDFKVENSDWLPSLEAQVELNGAEVSLSIDDADAATDGHAARFRELIAGWNQRLGEIANETEEYLQDFLPGKKITSDEIALWSITLYTNAGVSTAGTFQFNVTGEYDNPAYALDEFDGKSVVELQYSIENDVIDWSDGDMAATNDFD